MDNIFERILNAIETGKEKELLKFGNFTIYKKLGKGEQGVVLLARNPNGKLLAIKFYSPDGETLRIIKRGEKRFIQEVNILSKLTHHNITNVYMAGSAEWNDSEKKWLISYDATEPSKILFYIMGYIEGKNVKSLFYKSRIKNKDIIDTNKCTYDNQELFEQLILQISTCMTFFHKKKIAHRDIKPTNIIYSEHDHTFTIVDFGFAKSSQKKLSEYSEGVTRKNARIDLESEKLGEIDYLNDQYIFSEMLLEILELFKPLYVDYNYNGIKSSLEKGILPRKDRYQNMSEFKNAIELYLYSNPYHSHNFRIHSFLIPSSYFGYFKEKIRIPISGSVPIFKEIKDIITTADFQKLKGIKQLGCTNFVYPGATHTRFEHSLGTYFLSLKYLEILLKNPNFCEAAKPINESIKIVILASLLHDIGHYPYAHWIEEMEGLPADLAFDKHEDRAKYIIEKGEIGEMIEKTWEVNPSEVSKLIAGGGLSKKEELLRSIIHALIDVDKVDYLQRDSAHCGVPYGTAFDIERLISSLYINSKGNGICLTEKGRSPFLAFLMSNIVMYQEVYWHKTVRAGTAMLKRVFYDFIISQKDKINSIKQKLLSCPDEKFLEQLCEKTKKKINIKRLILPFMNQRRVLYKPAYVHYHKHALYTENVNTSNFFNKLSAISYPEQIKITSRLIGELNKTFFKDKKLNKTDIILETTPEKYHKRPELVGFQFYDSKQKRYSVLTPEVENLNTYLDANHRSYIFCNPDYYERIKKLSENRSLDNIFGNII